MVVSKKFPKTTGLDFVGEVITAPSVATFAAGDLVWGVLPLHRIGGIAEYVAIESRHLALRPANLSAIDAAALPVTGATALVALQDVTRLLPGERLLIRGAGGGVGSVAVQLGRAMGRACHRAGQRVRSRVRSRNRRGRSDRLRHGQAGHARIVRRDPRHRRQQHRVLPPDCSPTAGGSRRSHPIRTIRCGGWPTLRSPASIAAGASATSTPNPIPPSLSALTGRVESGMVRPFVDEVFPIARASPTPTGPSRIVAAAASRSSVSLGCLDHRPHSRWAFACPPFART